MKTRRNRMAVAVRSPLYRKRIVKARKGKGSYNRKKEQGNHG